MGEEPVCRPSYVVVIRFPGARLCPGLREPDCAPASRRQFTARPPGTSLRPGLPAARLRPGV